MSKQSVLVFAVLVLGACGGTPRATVDSGTGGTDAGTTPGTDSGAGPRDAGPGRDTGPVSTDPCASDAAGSLAGAGCNGGFVTSPAANAAGGACTGGGEADPQGTCTVAGICGAEADMPGFCFPSCTAGATYVSTSTCPTGFRCFDLDNDLCFLDCNATHPCPTGMTCDGEGSCVGE
jgi:hypothetical protein